MPSYERRPDHKKTTNAYLLIGLGFIITLASAYILFDPESAWISVISYGISFLLGIFASAIINRGLGYSMGIRRTRDRKYTIDYKFTSRYFSTTYKWFTIITGIIIGLWINSLPETNRMTIDIYSSISQAGLVDISIIISIIGLLAGGGLIYLGYKIQYP